MTAGPGGLVNVVGEFQKMIWYSQKSMGFIFLQDINPKNRYRYVLYTLVNTLSNRKLVLELGMGKCPWRYWNPALRRIWRLRIIQISFIKIFVIVQRAKLWFPYERCSISNDLLIPLFGFRQLLSWTFTGTPKTARSLLMVWPVSVWLCTTVAFYLKSWTNTL